MMFVPYYQNKTRSVMKGSVENSLQNPFPKTSLVTIAM
jgi:hypothetical protein